MGEGADDGNPEHGKGEAAAAALAGLPCRDVGEDPPVDGGPKTHDQCGEATCPARAAESTSAAWPPNGVGDGSSPPLSLSLLAPKTAENLARRLLFIPEMQASRQAACLPQRARCHSTRVACLDDVYR